MHNPSRSNGAAEKVASVDDILSEILQKLPNKSLIRSQLVSKQFQRNFLSLIRSHEFCLMRNPNPNPAIGILLLRYNHSSGYNPEYDYIPLHPENSSVPPPLNLGFTEEPSNAVILHSCNGLLLCGNGLMDYTLCHRSIYVYNPTTNLYTTLPHLDWNRHGATLVFDPVISRHYKVVLVDKLNWKILVFSSETGIWNNAVSVHEDLCRPGLLFKNGVYWNGSVHWINFSSQLVLLRFHVDTGTLVASPPAALVEHCNSRDDYWRNYYFGESCGHLHFVESIFPMINAYEMKRDYSQWFVKYKVDLSVFIGEVGSDMRYYNVSVLSLVRGEKDEDSKLVLRIPGKAVKVNVVDGTWEKLCDMQHTEYSVMNYFSRLDYIQAIYSV